MILLSTPQFSVWVFNRDYANYILAPKVIGPRRCSEISRIEMLTEISNNKLIVYFNEMVRLFFLIIVLKRRKDW